MGLRKEEGSPATVLYPGRAGRRANASLSRPVSRSRRLPSGSVLQARPSRGAHSGPLCLAPSAPRAAPETQTSLRGSSLVSIVPRPPPLQPRVTQGSSAPPSFRLSLGAPVPRLRLFPHPSWRKEARQGGGEGRRVGGGREGGEGDTGLGGGGGRKPGLGGGVRSKGGGRSAGKGSAWSQRSRLRAEHPHSSLSLPQSPHLEVRALH